MKLLFDPYSFIIGIVVHSQRASVACGVQERIETCCSRICLQNTLWS